EEEAATVDVAVQLSHAWKIGGGRVAKSDAAGSGWRTDPSGFTCWHRSAGSDGTGGESCQTPRRARNAAGARRASGLPAAQESSWRGRESSGERSRVVA